MGGTGVLKKSSQNMSMKMILPHHFESYLHLLDETRCKHWLLESLHPDGVTCPHCGRLLDDERLKLVFFDLKRIGCTECGRRFNAYTETPFEHTQLSPRQIVLLFLMLRSGIRASDICRLAEVSAASVVRWRDFLASQGEQLGQRVVERSQIFDPGCRDLSL